MTTICLLRGNKSCSKICGDLRAWEYAQGVGYLKSGDPSQVKQDLPAISGDSSDMPPAKKRKPDDVAPLM